MSWGIKITVLYLGFVALILSLVFICFGHKTELEYKDYYARELSFQSQINATANADQLSTPINYIVRDRSVQIILPKEVLSENMTGSVQFIRPSDASKDRTIPLSPGSDGVQMIDPGFMSGVYKMQITFKSGSKDYYKEATIRFK